MDFKKYIIPLFVLNFNVVRAYYNFRMRPGTAHLWYKNHPFSEAMLVSLLCMFYSFLNVITRFFIFFFFSHYKLDEKEILSKKTYLILINFKIHLNTNYYILCSSAIFYNYWNKIFQCFMQALNFFFFLIDRSIQLMS